MPEIESCLFADPKLLTGALGTPMTDEECCCRRVLIRVVLGNLLRAAKLNGDYAAAIGQILAKPDSLKLLAGCSPLMELREFIKMAPKAEWIAPGFRWPERASIELPGGSTITVEPSLHRSSLWKNGKTRRQEMALRFYSVWNSSGKSLGGDV